VRCQKQQKYNEISERENAVAGYLVGAFMNDTEAKIQGYQPETERRDASEYEVQQAMVFVNIFLQRL
jgi:hypothetical protein